MAVLKVSNVDVFKVCCEH